MHYINRIKIIFQEVLIYYVIFIFVFQIYRIALYHSYSNLFNDIDFLSFLKIIILGCRFDFSSTSVLLIIPIILLITPIPITGHWLYRRFIASIIYIELAGLIVFLNSDDACIKLVLSIIYPSCAITIPNLKYFLFTKATPQTCGNFNKIFSLIFSEGI